MRTTRHEQLRKTVLVCIRQILLSVANPPVALLPAASADAGLLASTKQSVVFFGQPCCCAVAEASSTELKLQQCSSRTRLPLQNHSPQSARAAQLHQKKRQAAAVTAWQGACLVPWHNWQARTTHSLVMLMMLQAMLLSLLLHQKIAHQIQLHKRVCLLVPCLALPCLALPSCLAFPLPLPLPLPLLLPCRCLRCNCQTVIFAQG